MFGIETKKQYVYQLDTGSKIRLIWVHSHLSLATLLHDETDYIPHFCL